MHATVVGGFGDVDVEVIRQARHDSVDSTQGLTQSGAVFDVEGLRFEVQAVSRSGVVTDDLESRIGKHDGDQFANLAQAEHGNLIDDADHGSSSMSTVDRTAT